MTTTNLVTMDERTGRIAYAAVAVCDLVASAPLAASELTQINRSLLRDPAWRPCADHAEDWIAAAVGPDAFADETNWATFEAAQAAFLQAK